MNWKSVAKARKKLSCAQSREAEGCRVRSASRFTTSFAQVHCAHTCTHASQFLQQICSIYMETFPIQGFSQAMWLLLPVV